MKLSETKMKHVLKPGVLMLSGLLSGAGFDIRIVGGAVRDLLMDIVPADLDLATTAGFHEMKQVFIKEQVRILRSSERNNTIMVRIEEENLDCTALYTTHHPSDVNTTQGKPLSDWEVDASHRDFTINAIYLGLDGTVYDYFNGVEHLKKGRVTFVVDPDQRIEEDPFRILRYFRFFGRVTPGPSKHDAAALESIRRNCEQVSTLVPEVIWKEVKMIVKGRFGVELFLQMMECGVGHHIGFPRDFDCEDVKRTFNRMQNAELDSQIEPCTLLASGFSCEEDIDDFIVTLKLSHKEKDIMKLILTKRRAFSSNETIKVMQDMLVDFVYKDKKSTKAAIDIVSELCKFAGRGDLLSEVTEDLIPEFPLKGGMLVDKVAKKRIHTEMKRLINLWQDSDYSLGSNELLSQIKS